MKAINHLLGAFAALLVSAGIACAQPATTYPNVYNTLSFCNSNAPVLGNGSGTRGVACGTVSGNTTKFMTGSGSFTNGDFAAFDANGNIVDGGAGSGGGTSLADESAFTQGTTSLTPIGGSYIPEASVTLLTSGQAGVARMTPNRFMLTELGLPVVTLSAWNSGTSLNATQTILAGTEAIAAALLQLDQTTTLTGGAVTAEGTYDGTNWVALAADQVVDPTSTTGAQISMPYTLQASTNKAFLLHVFGFQQVRIRLSTVITGTGTVTPYVTKIPYGVGTTLLPGVNPIGTVDPTTIGKWGLMSGTVPGTAPTNTAIVGCIYNSSAPSPTAGQTLPCQTDSSGRLIVSVNASTATLSNNITQFGGSNVVTGTGASGSGIPRVTVSNDSTVGLVAGSATVGKVDVLGNAGAIMDFAGQNASSPANALLTGCQFNTSPTTITSTNSSPVQCDNAGNTLVNLKTAIPAGTNVIGKIDVLGNAGAAFDQATGSAVPANGLYAGINVAGNLRGWTGVNPSGSIYAGQVDLASVAGTTASTAASGVLKVGVVGNANGAMDAAGANQSAPANELIVGGIYQSSPAAVTAGNVSQLQIDNHGSMRGVIMDGAGNARAANVTSGNNLNTIDAGTGATGSAVPANAGYMGVNVGGNLTGLVGDPCQVVAKTYVVINNAGSASNQQIITGTSSKKTYVCHMFVFAAAAQNLNLEEGTGTVCATNTTGMLGGATAALGINLAANQGFVLGNGESGVAITATAADNVCLFYSSTAQTSGVLSYVQL